MAREFRLANWLVTPELNRISDGDRSVSIERQVMEVLAFLAEHPGEVLSRDRILKAVWNDTFVTDDVLAYSISEIRKALGDDARNPRYVETIPRRGYRLIAQVHHQSPSPAVPAMGKEPRKQPFTSLRAGLILASVALMILAAAIWYFRPARALTESDLVLLGDIANRTGDPVFDEMLEAALAINLEQSPFLNLFPRDRIRDMLRYMERSPEEPVTPQIAREICQRQGIKAYITGSIEILGRNYVISLEATNAHTGEVIAREQVEVDARERILHALGQASSSMRGRLGESLPSIQKYDTPLEQATTESLEAFKAYSTGRKLIMTGQWVEAISHYARAVEIDPNFASAYDDMSYCYRVVRKRGYAADAARKAFSLRNRVSEYERHSIETAYYMFATEELDKAIEVAEAMRSVYPRSGTIVDTLAGLYQQVGLYEKALGLFDEALRINNDPIAQVDRAFTCLFLNRLAEAKQGAAQARATDSLAFRSLLFQIAFLEGNTAAMAEQVAWARGRPEEFFMLLSQASAAAFQGQVRTAWEFTRRSIDMAKRRDLPEAAADFTATMARIEALTGNCSLALEYARRVLAEGPDWQITARAATALAMCGEVQEAEGWADEIARRMPTGTLANGLHLPVLRAAIALSRRNGPRALQSLDGSEPYARISGFWTRHMRGQAYLSLRDGRAAAAEFKRILDNRGQAVLSPLYPLAYLGLARACALTGETSRSRKAYEDFLTLWKDADQTLPILRQAREEYRAIGIETADERR